MALRITQIDDPARNLTTLRVEGALRGEDAAELEKLYIGIEFRVGRTVVIDLAALQVLDEASAAILRHLQAQPSVSLAGCQLFIKQMIEASVDSQDANTLPPLTAQTKDNAKP